MDCMTLFAFPASLSCSSLPRTEGMICQDRPNLSFSQPHLPFSPPAERLSHSSSTSPCVSQFTNNEMGGVNVNCGQPFIARNSFPSSWKVHPVTFPSAPDRETPMILECLRMET